MNFRNLRAIGSYRIKNKRDNRLLGLCLDENKIYCVEKCWAFGTHWLAVYISSIWDGTLKILDLVEVKDCLRDDCRPCVDSSHRVYVPCGRFGVRIFHCQNGRLLPARDPLMHSIWGTHSIAVNTADTVFVVDGWTVRLVSVSSENVIRQLLRPTQVRDNPRQVSVLGETTLVCYGLKTLVRYLSDSPTPSQVLQAPEGVECVSSIIADSHSSSFLVTDWKGSVYVLDDKFLWYRVYVGSDTSELKDCAVSQSHLWLGYKNGDIALLRSL